MTHTTYANASGLPDPRQRTTVRDQAILARAVYEHFPQYYSYFSTQKFQYGRRVYGNHDYVLGFMGVDGLKTGYINASGYNLMTATRMGNRHLVVVAFGFNSGRARDAEVRSLVAKYLPKARQGNYLASAMIPVPRRGGSAPETMVASADEPSGMTASSSPIAPMPIPAFRQDQVLADPVAYAAEPMPRPEQQVASTASGAVVPMDIGMKPAIDAVSALGAPSSTQQASVKPDVVGQSLNNMLLGAPPTALGETRPSAPLVPPVGIGQNNQPVDLFTSGSISSRQVAEAALALEAEVLGTANKPAAKPTQVASLDRDDSVATPVAPEPAPAPSGSWVVQIGAAPTEAGANSLLTSAAKKIASLKDMRPYVEHFEKSGQDFYRARFLGFGSQKEAAAMCNSLKKAKMSCLAMQS
jgi:D-alanyl-D-alanine carboxypeptidase